MIVIWKFDRFERLVFNNWKFARQELYMNVCTGKLTWGNRKAYVY